MSVDPLASKYPFYTPYQYAGNHPINFIDIDGMEQGTTSYMNHSNTQGPVKQGGNSSTVSGDSSNVGNPIQVNETVTGVESDSLGTDSTVTDTPIQEDNSIMNSEDTDTPTETSTEPVNTPKVETKPMKWKGGGSPSSENVPSMKSLNERLNTIDKDPFSPVSLADSMKEAQAKNINNSAANKSPQSTGGYNIDKAVQFVTDNVNKVKTFGNGQCSPYVPRAINEGFGGKEVVPSSDGKNLAGSAYGPSLLKAGFEIVPVENLADYTPVKGDIAVMNGPPGAKTCNTGVGGPCGHIQMYNGKHWVSDFIQSNRPFWPGPDYAEHTPAFKIYRWNGN